MTDSRALISKRRAARLAAGLALVAVVVPPVRSSLGQAAEEGSLVQAHAVLTVSEGKRLIAKGVARLPVVRAALADGMVIITRGTTNTYIAEELLGKAIPHGAFVLGRTLPAGGGVPWPAAERIPDIILVRGAHDPDLTLQEALDRLQPGDVVIKGANALNYDEQQAGILIGSRDAGTIGAVWPRVKGRRAHLVIPVGLEKQIAGSVLETARRLNEPVEELTAGPSLFFVTGQIVTELEALRVLTGVAAFQAASGGVGGAEGATWLFFRGSREEVRAALDLLGEIQGEPPFPAPPPESPPLGAP